MQILNLVFVFVLGSLLFPAVGSLRGGGSVWNGLSASYLTDQ
jgi:hypothetical protein